MQKGSTTMHTWYLKVRNRLTQLNANQRGAEAMEYLVVTAMVIITTVAAWRYMGGKITDAINNISSAINNTTSSGILPF